MASLLQSERVLYLVRGEKELRAPLPQLYFCRYCSELRSLECVSHEVTADRPSCSRTPGGIGRDSALCVQRLGCSPATQSLSALLLVVGVAGGWAQRGTERGDWPRVTNGAVLRLGLAGRYCPSVELGL